MAIRFFLFVLALVLFLGCDGDDNEFVQFPIQACGVQNPLEELDWLRAELLKRSRDSDQNARYAFISQVNVEENTFFLYRDCDPLANSIITVYNCSGENIGIVGDDNFGFDLLLLSKEIFYPENTLCNFTAN